MKLQDGKENLTDDSDDETTFTIEGSDKAEGLKEEFP